MGTWGDGIFDDDTALDIRGTFEDALAEGCSVEAATQRVLDAYEHTLADQDYGPIVWLALAALQLEQGAVQPHVRDQTLAIIATGAGLERWEDAGEEAVAERRQVLAALNARLDATPPTSTER